MDFGKAIEALKQGKKVSRSGWNGKGMFLLLVRGKAWYIYDAKTARIAARGGNGTPESEFDMPKPILSPFIGMKTATGEFVPWLASQTDLLSDDWEIKE